MDIKIVRDAAAVAELAYVRLAGIMRSRKTRRNSVNMLEVNEVPRG